MKYVIEVVRQSKGYLAWVANNPEIATRCSFSFQAKSQIADEISLLTGKHISEDDILTVEEFALLQQEAGGGVI